MDEAKTGKVPTKWAHVHLVWRQNPEGDVHWWLVSTWRGGGSKYVGPEFPDDAQVEDFVDRAKTFLD